MGWIDTPWTLIPRHHRRQRRPFSRRQPQPPRIPLPTIADHPPDNAVLFPVKDPYLRPAHHARDTGRLGRVLHRKSDGLPCPVGLAILSLADVAAVPSPAAHPLGPAERGLPLQRSEPGTRLGGCNLGPRKPPARFVPSSAHGSYYRDRGRRCAMTTRRRRRHVRGRD